MRHCQPQKIYYIFLLFFVSRHLFHFLSEEEKRVVKSLGYKILNDLQTGMICPSSVLVAAIMLQNLKGIFFGMPKL